MAFTTHLYMNLTCSSIQPSILGLTGVGSRWQQAKQRIPGVPPHSNIMGDPEVFQRQMGHKIWVYHQVYSQMHIPEDLQREAFRMHPCWMLKPRLLALVNAREQQLYSELPPDVHPPYTASIQRELLKGHSSKLGAMCEGWNIVGLVNQGLMAKLSSLFTIQHTCHNNSPSQPIFPSVVIQFPLSGEPPARNLEGLAIHHFQVEGYSLRFGGAESLPGLSPHCSAC